MSNEDKKQAQFFVRPEKQTAKDLGDTIADGLIAQINADRIAQGLPPLEKDEPKE